MYCNEKQSKPRKTHRNHPSFSSSLLDEICRSIDGGPTEIPANPKLKTTRSEEAARPCLADKKTPKSKKTDNIIFPDTDADFFKIPNPIRTTKYTDNILIADYQHYENNNNNNNQFDDRSTKSKSKILKIYAQLKKLKQPVSPGAKLSSLINSFFSKKSKKDIDSNSRNAVDCGGRSSYDVKSCGRPPLPPNAVRAGDQRRLRELSIFGKAEDEDEDKDGDGASESSSDLFELDHLSLYGRGEGFCEELPVYGTTYFDKNRGLIR